MNILLVEDEEQSARRLRRTLEKLIPGAFFHGPVESVGQLVDWIQTHPSPDLAFMDIHIADGLSFEVLEKTEIDFPLIFTTAYDQYALRAFKHNSVDYLLKPIGEEELQKALDKFNKRYIEPLSKKLGPNWSALLSEDYRNRYKQRFVTRLGDRLLTVETSDVFYGFSENRASYLVADDGKKYLIDFSLERLESVLDPAVFFRLNRQYIARFEAIERIVRYSNSRIRVTLKGREDENIVLSREKTAEFREWIDR